MSEKKRRAMLFWFGLDPDMKRTAEEALQFIAGVGECLNDVSLSYERTPCQNGEWVARMKSSSMEVEERAETAWEALEQAGAHFLPDYWERLVHA